MANFAGTFWNDNFTGTSGADTMTGNIGNDRLNGAGGDDIISGNSGADILTGGAGLDTFRDTAAGLNGDTIADFQAGDKIIITNANLATFSFSLSGNTLAYSGGSLTFGSALAGTLVAAAAPGGGVQLTLSTAPPVDPTGGTTGDDHLVGGAGNDQFNGIGGNDVLVGNAGSDTLNGGEGGDWLFSHAIDPAFDYPYRGISYDIYSEHDVLNGGDGWDHIFAGFGDSVDGGAGADRLYISFLGAPTGITVDFRLQTQVIGGGTITGIETISWLQGSNYDDTINASNQPNVGGPEDGTSVFAMGGNDTIIAGEYAAVLDGGDGNDILNAAASRYLVSISGGAGDDVIQAGKSYAGGVAYGGDGNDTIDSALRETYGGAGDDTIVISGVAASAFGDDGDDQIRGAYRTDGGAGADVIQGRSGNAIITGGAGADVLTAYGERDVFIDTMSGLNGDLITDFDTTDRIVFTDATLETFSFSLSAKTLTYGGQSLSFGTSLVGEFVASAAPEGGVELHLVSSPVAGTIYGSSGADTLNGTASADRIDGFEGDDVIAGGSGADTLLGGQGSDWLYSSIISPYNNYEYFETPYPLPLLDTGTEVDTLVGGSGVDTFFAGYGDNVDGGLDLLHSPGDTLFISFLGAPTGITADFRLETQVIGGGTITGIETVAWVQGSNYDDNIILGNRSVNGIQGSAAFGMAGNDTLVAENLTVFLDGGEGNDTVDGRQSSELQEIRGGSGDDIVYSAIWSAAVAYGGSGEDTIYANGTAHGEGGDDKLIGGDFADQLAGGAGVDTILGGEGDDWLYSAQESSSFSWPWLDSPFTPPVLDTGSEVDTLKGGLGSDTIFAGYGDNVDGGSENPYDNDVLYISFLGASSGVTVDFRSESQVVGGGTIEGIESVVWVQGSAVDDNIIAAYSTKVVFGMGGNDTLIASYYTDHLDGGEGNDVLDGRGSSYLRGVNGGVGSDTLYTTAIARADGGDGDDFIYAKGEAYGGSGNDTIVSNAEYYAGQLAGEGGDDRITGASNVGDVILGGAGADVITGGTGKDTLTGGADADTFRDTAGGLNGDTITDFQSGDKIIITDANLAGFTSSLSGTTLTFTGGSLTFGTALGGSFVASAAVGGGVQLDWVSTPPPPPPPPPSTITGTSSANTLNGTGGNDRIEGLGGNDTLNGLGGNDVLVGGAGADRLSGGVGADTFVYTSSGESTLLSRDQIQLFEAGDKIDLSLIDANRGTAANDAFAFIGSDAFHGVAGELRAVQRNGSWSVEADTNGDRIADLAMTVTLSGISALSVDHFIL